MTEKHVANALNVASTMRDELRISESLINIAVSSRYKRTNDHSVLGEVPEQINEKYPYSVWALKASVWSH